MQSDAMRLQQMEAQLGVAPPAAPAVEEEVLCVVCMDAPKQHIILPCGHQCVCETCAKEFKPKTVKKRKTRKDCPVCRAKIDQTIRVFL